MVRAPPKPPKFCNGAIPWQQGKTIIIQGSRNSRIFKKSILFKLDDLGQNRMSIREAHPYAANEVEFLPDFDFIWH